MIVKREQKKAHQFEKINEEKTIDPHLALVGLLPDATYLANVLKSLLGNWYLTLSNNVVVYYFYIL